MRETRSYGSVRGVRRKPYPYRDKGTAAAKQRPHGLLSSRLRSGLADQHAIGPMGKPGPQQAENGDRQQARLVPGYLKRHQVGAPNGRSAVSSNRTVRSSAVRKAASAGTSVVLP